MRVGVNEYNRTRSVGYEQLWRPLRAWPAHGAPPSKGAVEDERMSSIRPGLNLPSMLLRSIGRAAAAMLLGTPCWESVGARARDCTQSAVYVRSTTKQHARCTRRGRTQERA